MRKLKLLFLMVPIVILAACSGNNPEAVAKKFNKAIYTADFQTAKSLCTDDSKQVVDFVAAFASQKVDEMKKAEVKYEITNVKIADDGKTAEVNAVVLGTINLENGEVKDSIDSKTHLVKLNDKWMVEFKLK